MDLQLTGKTALVTGASGTVAVAACRHRRERGRGLAGALSQPGGDRFLGLSWRVRHVIAHEP